MQCLRPFWSRRWNCCRHKTYRASRKYREPSADGPAAPKTLCLVRLWAGTQATDYRYSRQRTESVELADFPKLYRKPPYPSNEVSEDGTEAVAYEDSQSTRLDSRRHKALARTRQEYAARPRIH